MIWVEVELDLSVLTFHHDIESNANTALEINLPSRFFLEVNERPYHTKATALLSWRHGIKLLKKCQWVYSESLIRIWTEFKAAKMANNKFR